MTKRLVALFLAIALALAVVSSGFAAGSASKAFKTKVTIVQGDGTDFHGKVKSKKAACKKKRKVTLQIMTTYQSSFHTLGAVKSKRNGNWKRPTTVQSGAQYRAKVKKKTLHNGDKCKAKTSRVVTAT
ncbi:MAG TPA: hypothetical protein VKG89_04120 [Solirubrobacterales bacterium]|nr:hypothetical protein [Solirubrobacterales bacterium]